MTTLTRAWLRLAALGLVTTALAAAPLPVSPLASAAVAAAILLIAFLKMRLILRAYLELARSRTWRVAFDWVLGTFSLLLYGLWLIPILQG
jgi:hypothetical protein